MQNTLTSTFSERLKSIMDETGIRQTELCEKAGIGRSAMCQYLHVFDKNALDDGTLQIHGVVERVEIKF